MELVEGTTLAELIGKKIPTSSPVASNVALSSGRSHR
jgi:hypothetical protein